MSRKRTASEAVAAYRQVITTWVDWLEKRFDVTRNQLARRSGVRSSTIYRWFDELEGNVPSHASVLKIAAAFEVPPPHIGGPPPAEASEPEALEGFAEPGVAIIGPRPEEDSRLTPNQSWWRVGDRSLELAGFLPGDQVLLDQTIPARAGDAVIAQIYDFERGAAETKLRWYDPPFLTARTMDPALAAKPLLVDSERVVIIGPIVRLVRERVT